MQYVISRSLTKVEAGFPNYLGNLSPICGFCFEEIEQSDIMVDNYPDTFWMHTKDNTPICDGPMK